MSNNIVATPPPRSRAASWFIVVPPSREIGPPTSRDTPAIVTICFRRACDVRPRIRTRIHTRTRTSLSLQSAANSSRPRSCSKRTRLKSFEIVWSRLKTFEDVWTSDFRFPWNGIWFFFFFLRGRLYDERDLLPRVERKEGTDVNENDVNIRSGWEEKRVFCLYSLEKKWRLLIVLFWFEANTRHCLNYKEMNKIRMQRNDRWSNLSDLIRITWNVSGLNRFDLTGYNYVITRIPRNRRRAGGGQSNLSRSNQLAISNRVYIRILKPPPRKTV